MTSTEELMACTVENCAICKQAGEPLYTDLQDVLFGVAGEWALMRCAKCEIAWLKHRPKDDDIHKLYETYHTHDKPDIKFTKGIHRFKWMLRKAILVNAHLYTGSAAEKIVGFLLSLIPGLKNEPLPATLWLPGPQGQLLDIGCGNGVFLKKMQQLGWSGRGIEFDGESVKQAQGIGLDVTVGSVESQEYADNHFDAITMNHVIEHLPDPAFTLQECFRILKPGGHLMMVTPNLNAMGHTKFKQAWRGLEIPRHLTVFSEHSLGTLVKQASFSLVSTKTIARTAKNMYLASLDIQYKQQGLLSADLSSHKADARVFQKSQSDLVESSDCGEELYILAKKPLEP